MGPVRRGAALVSAWYAASPWEPGTIVPGDVRLAPLTRLRRHRSGSAAGGPTTPRLDGGGGGRLVRVCLQRDPDQFAEARARLDDHLRAAGREPDTFPDAVATSGSTSPRAAGRRIEILTNVLGPRSNRDPSLRSRTSRSAAPSTAPTCWPRTAPREPARSCSGRLRDTLRAARARHGRCVVALRGGSMDKVDYDERLHAVYAAGRQM